jgi:hypothetical protein
MGNLLSLVGFSDSGGFGAIVSSIMHVTSERFLGVCRVSVRLMPDISRKSRKGRPALRNEIELTGTPNQVEWAERIRLTVAQEFDRVAKAFQARIAVQTGEKQSETRTILKILEQKRAETMSIHIAGYFIREWQDLSDQVRQMIAKDPRYHAIRDQRATRRRTTI